jgi:hypothetical protein
MVKYNAAFVDRLRQLGYIDGKTVQIHGRYAGGVLDRLPGLARELHDNGDPGRGLARRQAGSNGHRDDHVHLERHQAIN